MFICVCVCVCEIGKKILERSEITFGNRKFVQSGDTTIVVFYLQFSTTVFPLINKDKKIFQIIPTLTPKNKRKKAIIMHSTISRTNSVLSVTFVAVASCAFLMGFLSYLRHEYIFPAQPTGTITVVDNRVHNIIQRHPQQHTSTQVLQQAVLFFDINADFTECFDWNTKQVFVYVVAEYATKKHVVNQVTLFDRIITKKEEAKLELTRDAKYPLTHIAGKGLSNNPNMTLKLKYHIMCNSGVTHTKEVPSATVSFKMPKVNHH